MGKTFKIARYENHYTVYKNQKPKTWKKLKPENPDPRTMLLTGIIVAAEDRHPVVQEKQNEDQNECHPNRRPTDPMDGIGLTGWKDVRDKWATFGGEELDGEEEDDGEEEKTHGAQ